MSNLILKRIKQVVSGATQALKIGGIQDDGSDAKITINTDGTINLGAGTTGTSLAVTSLTVNGSSIISGALFAESVVSGAAVTTLTISDLDINTHKSYRIEIEVVNTSGSTSDYSLYVNGDTTATNYYRQNLDSASTTNAGTRQNTALLLSLTAGMSMILAGNLMSTNSYLRGTFLGTRYTTGITVDTIGYYKTATITNLTSVTLSASVASSIGIGSKIRIYRGDV